MPFKPVFQGSEGASRGAPGCKRLSLDNTCETLTQTRFSGSPQSSLQAFSWAWRLWAVPPPSASAEPMWVAPGWPVGAGVALQTSPMDPTATLTGAHMVAGRSGRGVAWGEGLGGGSCEDSDLPVCSSHPCT